MRGLKALASFIALSAVLTIGAPPSAGEAGEPLPASDLELGFAIPRGFIDHSDDGSGHVAAESFRAVAPTAAKIRTAVIWNQVQPDCEAIRDERYDWSKPDADMRLFVEEGVSRLITLNGGPVCAAVQGQQGFEPRRRYRDDFGRFARAVLERYGPGGEFFAENPDLAGGCCPVTQIEIWNEPNLGKKWSRPDGKRFGVFFRGVAKQVRLAANWGPGIELITGGVTGLNGGRWKSNGRSFVRGLLGTRSIEEYIGAVGVHTYTNRPAQAIDNLRIVRRSIRRAGLDAPIEITEHGWSTCPRPGHESSNGKCVTPARQARMMDGLITRLSAPANAALGVRSFLWFMAQDSATPRSVRRCPTSPKFFYGLYEHSGERKPSWRVWSEHTDGGMPERIGRNRSTSKCA
ncbi:hypothetical protein HJD18_15310 [Thermoleophilia bacterium SCSIO 60948]|nr:hypothetical protein HJD18_15310 [Thermoleophilia bacterium SCSIO 60948]